MCVCDIVCVLCVWDCDIVCVCVCMRAWVCDFVCVCVCMYCFMSFGCAWSFVIFVCLCVHVCDCFN